MTLLDESLATEMAVWEAAGLRRRLDGDDDDDHGDHDGSRGADFCSNDYLGLAGHPAVIEAARDALARHGAGARASRLLGGGSPAHEAAERAAADWLGAESALLFPSGYQANLGVVTALIGRGDAVFSDQWNHASLIDAARLSRARTHVYRHLDLEELERMLARERGARRRLVLTESIFSMDGDAAPLDELDELCRRYEAWLVVDEAHAAGLLGPEGAGAWGRRTSDRPRSPRLIARVVTGGKALGVCGAFAATSAVLREHLVNRARAFVFTTAPTPATAGALVRAIELCRAGDDLRERALANARALEKGSDTVECTIADRPWVQQPFPYQGKCLQWLREQRAALV
ncbi:MAG: aminotransferase class I/II-fold pyridoxal phosphate-dependent enzyme, partial [Planctomycetota bacterium]|nr:aminotransferase class I/II-fold pyridoxal phosphate-dependent enzyme [Planctomycetota bacterium]